MTERRNRGRLWKGLLARATTSGMDLLEQEKSESCTSCAKASASGLVTKVGNTGLCQGCMDRLRAEKEDSLPPPEERFDELFRAARVLLKEGIDQEDQIIPTLALANLTYEEIPDLGVRHRFEKPTEYGDGWERWVDRWVSAYGSLRPVRMVGGVLI